jgi:hypothetical protein
MLEDEAASVACRSGVDLQRPHATFAVFEHPHCRRGNETAEVVRSAVPPIHSLRTYSWLFPTEFMKLAGPSAVVSGSRRRHRHEI